MVPSFLLPTEPRLMSEGSGRGKERECVCLACLVGWFDGWEIGARKGGGGGGGKEFEN